MTAPLTSRELDVLWQVYNASPSPVPPKQLAGQLGISTGYAREVANALAHRGLLDKFRATHIHGRVSYTLTATGLETLKGDRS